MQPPIQISIKLTILARSLLLFSLAPKNNRRKHEFIIHIGIWCAFIIGHQVRNEEFLVGGIDCIAFFVAAKNEQKFFCNNISEITLLCSIIIGRIT